MNESTKDNLKHIGTGAMLVATFGLVAGVSFGLVRNGQAEPVAVLDPVVAYCHGVTDGIAHAGEVNRGLLEANGVPVPPYSEQQAEANDASCIQFLSQPDPALRPHLRGPLLPPEDES